MKPKIKPKSKKKPVLLPEAEQVEAKALGLVGYAWSKRWAFCWVERHGTHVIKAFDDFDQWACLEHGVVWRTKKKRIKE